MTLIRPLTMDDRRILERARPPIRAIAVDVARMWVDWERIATLRPEHLVPADRHCTECGRLDREHGEGRDQYVLGHRFASRRSLDLLLAYTGALTELQRVKGWDYVAALQTTLAGPGGMRGADSLELADLLALALELTGDS